MSFFLDEFDPDSPENNPQEYMRIDDNGDELFPGDEGYEDAEDPVTKEEMLDIMFDTEDDSYDEDDVTYDDGD